MLSMKRLAMVAGMLAASLPASAAHFRGGIFVGPAYPFGWYGPYGYYGYGPGYPMVARPTGGELKIDTKLTNAEVWIDGAFAGSVKDVKSMHLKQGSYDVVVKAPGRESFETNVYVVNGKTIHIHPELRAQAAS